jgi:hypothetical protein
MDILNFILIEIIAYMFIGKAIIPHGDGYQSRRLLSIITFLIGGGVYYVVYELLAQTELPEYWVTIVAGLIILISILNYFKIWKKS